VVQIATLPRRSAAAAEHGLPGDVTGLIREQEGVGAAISSGLLRRRIGISDTKRCSASLPKGVF
jgi:hypothetical protein